MLCALLLQVQTVFACQMMDQSESIEHCCCDDDASSTAMCNDQTDSAQCCKYSINIAMDIAGDGSDPVIITSHSSLDPPPITIVFLLAALWPDISQAALPLVLWDLASKPANSGTNTWLSTLRLRL